MSLRCRCRAAGSTLSLRAPACWILVAILAVAVPAWGLITPERSPLGDKAFRNPGLDIAAAYRTPDGLPAQAAARAVGDLAALGLPADRGILDIRGGRWETLIPTEPLVPGPGVGNELTWGGMELSAPADLQALGQAAWAAARGYLAGHAAELRIDPAQLGEARVTVLDGGARIDVYVPRVVAGVPVRGSFLDLAINQGNLILLGTHLWGDVGVSTRPAVPVDAARAAVQAHVEPMTVAGTWAPSELVLVPMARGADPDLVAVGQGYTHRLAWVVHPAFEDDAGRWEALVDAASGEVLSFADTNDYVATERRVRGGVYPVSNDGVSPDGVEQAGWPMPFDRVSTPSGTVTTDAGGNLPSPVDGNISSTLAGQFVRMNDLCGAISLTSASDLDFGASGGIDCTTPGFGGAGNTHASRTGFYELNRIKEMGRGQLPANTWLNNQLTSNMNINNVCNAFWNGSTVNFYRSGGGCSNTGEIAGVFDHEWGHGLDANDATPGVSSPGEGIADLYAALRLNSSCIGRNFRPGIQCGGYGDPCVACTGVRDIDFAKRASGLPHTFTWANANCGGGVHCRGYVYSESVWDLWKRDLPSLFGMDDHTAHEVVTRLTYVGAGGVSTWFSGSPPFGGCSTTGGYMRYLVADDDNGTLGDGTPHMTAIFAAFNRHEIACSTPTVQNSGCVGTPTTAPTLTATAANKGANLSWTPVGATTYQVFRTDGVHGCDFGRVKVADTAATNFADGGLQNGHDYFYIVIGKGPAPSCFGPASACATVTPTASFCGDGTCNPGEDSCSCPADCGAPPASEAGLCTDSADNDCDGFTDCADADCATDPFCTSACDNDGTCESGEDCTTCPGDCPSSPPVAPGCGNGFCEPGIGEDCLSCPADCNGRQSGNPSGRFCCGDGDGQNPVNCGDARCNSGGFVCSNILPGGFCCGQNGCETGESACDCALDCGAPPLFEQPGLTCTDGIDNDCDGLTDCADPTNCTGSGDCPVCGQQGAPCTQNGQCCSGVCKGNGTCK